MTDNSLAAAALEEEQDIIAPVFLYLLHRRIIEGSSSLAGWMHLCDIGSSSSRPVSFLGHILNFTTFIDSFPSVKVFLHSHQAAHLSYLLHRFSDKQSISETTTTL